VQLTIYALALARRIGLPLKAFKCAWFDEHDYFEFFPLQGVYRTKSGVAAVSCGKGANRCRASVFLRRTIPAESIDPAHFPQISRKH
jgi:hypothetical protein